MPTLLRFWDELRQWSVIPANQLSGIVPLANGGSGADLSATGGTGFVVQQASPGAPFTVGPAPLTGGRTLLTVATNFYYKPSSGNDNNPGTIGSPWASPAPLWKLYDFGGQVVTLNLLETTASQFIPRAWTGGGSLVLDLGGFAINAVNQDCVLCTDSLPGIFTVQNGALSNSGSGFFSCINHQGGGTIQNGGSLTFNGALLSHWTVVGGAAKIFVTVGYTIAGDAPAHILTFTSAEFLQATTAASLSGPQITITGARTFSFEFVGAANSSNVIIRPFNNAGINQSPYVVGTSVTGKRFDLSSNSAINTLGGGANFFPGTVAGTNDGTGIYS